MNPRRLSRELRLGQSDYLSRRRGIVVLALAATGALGVVSLYQMGIIRRVPEPRLPGLDAEKVDSSDEAYSILQTPDALLGMASYGATAVLAGMSGERRYRDRPWVPIAMAGKVLVDAAVAAKLTWDQWSKHRAFCSWCLLAAGAAFASVPLALPETAAAVRKLLGREPLRMRQWEMRGGRGPERGVPSVK